MKYFIISTLMVCFSLSALATSSYEKASFKVQQAVSAHLEELYVSLDIVFYTKLLEGHIQGDLELAEQIQKKYKLKGNELLILENELTLRTVEFLQRNGSDIKFYD